jgi:hypothetical protein
MVTSALSRVEVVRAVAAGGDRAVERRAASLIASIRSR